VALNFEKLTPSVRSAGLSLSHIALIWENRGHGSSDSHRTA